MKIIIFIAIIFSANVASFRKAKNHKHDNRIFDGHTVDNLIEFPYMCSITLVDLVNDQFICGCSIISPKYALSAAHCFDDLGVISRIFFFAGTTKVNQGPVKYEIKKKCIAKHSKYVQNTKENYYDIALIKFKPLPLSATIQPIKLSSRKSQCTYTNKDFYILGWGQFREDGPVSQDLLYREVAPASAMECRSHYNTYNDDLEMCSSLSSGSSGCFGDSGGPFAMPAGYEDILCGVISSNKGRCIKSTGIYTRVSYYHRWICDKTNNDPQTCKNRFRIKRKHHKGLRSAGNSSKFN